MSGIGHQKPKAGVGRRWRHLVPFVAVIPSRKPTRDDLTQGE
jgi:hypothetical protein